MRGIKLGVVSDAPHQLVERELGVRVERERRGARAAVGDDARGQDARIDLAELALQQHVEHLLELEPVLLVDRIDPRAHGVARQREPGVDHALDRRGHGVALHAHEVHQRVVEIEDDRADHALPRKTRPVRRGPTF